MFHIPIPLADKQFVMLREEKKNMMKLGRYDQYFFEQWEKDIEFDEKESVPQVFLKGDSIVTYSFTTDEYKNSLNIHFRYFSLLSGEEAGQVRYSFYSNALAVHKPGIAFSDDHSKFVVYNVQKDSAAYSYLIYRLGMDEPIKEHNFSAAKLPASSLAGVHLSDNGDLLLVSVDANSFKTDVYFWSNKNGHVKHVESNFFLERPAERIANIDVVRQGPSSYFITFTANIDDELIGFSIVGVNVILKSEMFAHNQNFNKEQITEAYENYYVTGEKQKKKNLQLPETLDDFRLARSFSNEDNDIILVFEELEIPIEFHSRRTENNMPWKHKPDQDKFYFGGDLLIYCFSETGQVKWKKAIQKSQYSQANGLGLSFIPRMHENMLDLLCYESAKGGNSIFCPSILPMDLWRTKSTYFPMRNLNLPSDTLAGWQIRQLFYLA
jgi:hypothetical protein